TLDLSSLADGAVTLTASQTDAAGNVGTGTRAVVKVSVSVRSNQVIAGFAHAIDLYVPSNAQSAVVFLHGGGGNKERFAYDLDIKNDAGSTNYAASASGITWLANERVAAIFPQGQTLSGYNAWTWNNYFMNSGQNDVAFLQTLVAAIKADPALQSITKVYVAGHSNGGMMANRMWCESPTTFDGFGALAGPPSIHLDPTLAASATNHPCNPATVKPYISIVGDSDTVLQSTGNMTNKVWVLKSSLHVGASPVYVDNDPSVLNDALFHSARVAMKCSGTISPATLSGQITRFSDCNNSVKLVVVSQSTARGRPSGGDHCLASLVASCVTTLAGTTGLDPKTELVNFLKRF
ncbi:MAG: PHB depolymerase family esterase, partial [Planctomycetota bacterium]